MSNRTIEIKCRLNQKEADTLNRRVKKSGLSREYYLRHLISGLVPTDAPTPDYFAMTRELRYIGNNMSQIARKAHGMNLLDAKRYDENAAALKKAVVDITNAVMLPRKIEKKATGSSINPQTFGGDERFRSGESFDAHVQSDERRAL